MNPTPAARLQGKTAIITGAASGFGRATALSFAREGAQVVVADLQAEAGQALVSTLQQQGHPALFVPCDVSREDSVQALVQATVAGGLEEQVLRDRELRAEHQPGGRARGDHPIAPLGRRLCGELRVLQQ
jgi:NAD(P)-dependent dehydrogenase (short-subunit alcohol dehydrogenase family)